MTKLIALFKNQLREHGFGKFVYLLLYYYLFKYFPKSTNPVFGKMSKRLRHMCCKRIFKHCGVNVNIEKGASFGAGFELEIGDNSGIGYNCRVPSNIYIGKNVMMGPNCYILDANHRFDSIDMPMISQGHMAKLKTTINDDVWIGRDVLFTPGRTVSEGSIVAARCVLTKDFPAFSIVGGNPGKVIKSRV